MVTLMFPALLLILAAPPSPTHATDMAASQKLFVEKVRPYLVANCLECHGGEKVRGGFNLSSRELLIEGSDNGTAIVPGKGAESLMVMLVGHTGEPHMPPKKPVNPDAAKLLSQWIDLGAAYDRPLIEDESTPETKGMQVTDKDRDYWAYKPLIPVVPPTIDNALSINSIDNFILAKRGSDNAVSLADKRTLIRRVTFDLIGLPPTIEEVDAFLADDSKNAYENVVDRLLASPRFGERWARHWLDPARYGESHGFEHDYDRPFAFHYRDFVIRAFNNDMPYDQFVQWQLAGDELAPNNPEALAATGFLAAGVYPTQITTTEAERVRYDAMDDMLATTGHTMLALTVGCARCHDHKFDPIPTRDYYRMLSAFTTTVRAEIDIPLTTLWGHTFSTKMQVASEGVTPMRHHTSVGSIPDFYKETFILSRGDVAQKEEVANMGVLQLLSHDESWKQEKPKDATTSFRRASLAKWLTDVPNGAGSLAARVMVNRMWHHHFGEGIVTTLNDFGLQGAPPTHPKLLEWLAVDLVQHGWKLKRLHKLMVMSEHYRETRPTSHRLEAEAIRDSLLSVSGLLDTTMYGPGTLDESMRRRSIYFQVKRSALIPMLQVFDWPDTLTSAGVRPTTTVAPQALVFMNSPMVHAYAKGFAKRLQPALNESPEAAVKLAYQMAFARLPSDNEVSMAIKYLREHTLEEYALVVLSLNEFIMVK